MKLEELRRRLREGQHAQDGPDVPTRRNKPVARPVAPPMHQNCRSYGVDLAHGPVVHMIAVTCERCGLVTQVAECDLDTVVFAECEKCGVNAK